MPRTTHERKEELLQIRLTRRMLEQLKRTAKQRELAVGEYVRILILMDRKNGRGI